MSTGTPPPVYRFGEFELDVAAYELRRGGRRLRVERQPMDLLLLLVRRHGELVTRSEIVDALWGRDVFVDVETGVHTAARKVRLALGDSAVGPRFVENVPGKGYRFIAPVLTDALSVAAPGGPAPPPSPGEEPPPHRVPAPPDAVARDTVVPVAPGRRPLPMGLVSAIAVVVATAIVLIVLNLQPAPAPARLTLAVLPFANLSGDPSREYLADGLTEETIATLGEVDPSRVFIIGRTSTMSYKNTSKSLMQIGAELGADYLVESSIRAEGPQLRITAKLIRATDQVQVWSDSFNRAPTSMIGLQQELSTAIAREIGVQLSPDRRELLTRRQTRRADAYDLYLRARNFGNQRTPETTRQAIDYFSRATAIDPDYALAWASLALVHGASTINGDAPPREAGAKARAAAERAVAADPELAEALAASGNVAWLIEWDWPRAEQLLRQAARRDPRLGVARWQLGHLLSQEGRHEEARAELKAGTEVDPQEPMAYALASQVEFQSGNYQAAVERARRAALLGPQFWIAYAMEAQALERIGDSEAALGALEKSARFSGGNSKSLSLAGYIHARAGHRAEARQAIDTLETLSSTHYVPPYAIALIHAGLDERDATFAWLEKAYEARDVHLIFLTVDPKWNPYRQDPRFESLIDRCGFRRR